MTTYARIVDGYAVDVMTTDPSPLFHPSVAATFVTVPDGTANGDRKTGSTWKKYVPPTTDAAPPAVELPRLTPMTFYLAFSPAERMKIKTSADPLVAEFWDTYQRAERTDTDVDPNLISIQEGLGYLVQVGILASASRVPDLLAGIPQ